jgi:signal transduction histidine kinase
LATVRTIAAILDEDPTRAAEVAATLAALVDDAQWEVRLAVAQAIAGLSDELAHPLAAKLLGDPNDYVRRAARRVNERTTRPRSRPGPVREPIDRVAHRVERLRGREGDAIAGLVGELARELYATTTLETNHELRTILTGLLQWSRRQRDELAHADMRLEVVRRCNERTLAQLELLARMLEDNHALVAAHPVQVEAVRLDTFVGELLDMIDPVLEEHGVELRHEIDCQAAEVVELPRARLLQALSSLVKNAIEAVAALPVDDRAPVRLSFTQIGSKLEVFIVDEGPGMDERDLRRAMMPMRTTKRQGCHTGMGLPLAERIVERDCDGQLRIDSAPDTGTRVQVLVDAFAYEEEENTNVRNRTDPDQLPKMHRPRRRGRRERARNHP